MKVMIMFGVNSNKKFLAQCTKTISQGTVDNFGI